MFLAFTPFSYLFLLVYSFLIITLFTIRRFYLFWVYIEILMLLFIGLSYTLFTHSYTQLMLYFLIQTLASFSMLVFYTLDYSYMLYFSLFLKLGMFPFISWYLNVLYRFPNFILFLSSTLHKLPPLMLFWLVYSQEFVSFIIISVAISVLVGGYYILTILDLRYLIVVSSIANNGFLLLSLISGALASFTIFYTIYIFNMLLILGILGILVKPLVVVSRFKRFQVLLMILLLLNIASLPPLPIFLAKFIIIYDFFITNPTSSFWVILLLLANVAIIASYCQMFIKYITQTYANSRSYLLY